MCGFVERYFTDDYNRRMEDNRRSIRALCFILVLGWVCVALGDVVVLRDGRRLEGELRRVGAMWELTDPQGKVVRIDPREVQSIRIGPSSTDADTAAANLASLRRAVRHVPDVSDIIRRFERFIEQHQGTPAAEEAGKDLAVWKDRRERGLVRFGEQWITPEERRDLLAANLAAAEQVRALLAEGQAAQAEVLLEKVLADHPENASALYLRGVLLYRQDKIREARAAFEAVERLQPDHAPTLNNLAVILHRQRQTMQALGYWHRALIASPVNRFLLDNVADVLGTLPDDQRRNPVVQRLTRLAAEQELLLAPLMAEQGLYRWGSTWVDQKTMDQIRASELEARARIDTLQTEFDAVKARIDQIDRDIASGEATLRHIEHTSVFRDAEGRLIRLPYPPSYYETRRHIELLRSERVQQESRMQSLREQAQRVQSQLPVPRFTGIQQIVGIEGMPTVPVE